MHRAPFRVHISSVHSALNAVSWCRLACPSASHAVRAFHEAGWSGRGSRFFSNFFLTTAPCKTSEKSLESAFARNIQDPVSGMQSHIFSFSFLVKALPLPPPVFWIFWKAHNCLPAPGKKQPEGELHKKCGWADKKGPGNYKTTATAWRCISLLGLLCGLIFWVCQR